MEAEVQLRAARASRFTLCCASDEWSPRPGFPPTRARQTRTSPRFDVSPDNRWMAQVARNVTDLEEGFFRGKRYLILDRDTKYSSVGDRQHEPAGRRGTRPRGARHRVYDPHQPPGAAQHRDRDRTRERLPPSVRDRRLHRARGSRAHADPPTTQRRCYARNRDAELAVEGCIR